MVEAIIGAVASLGTATLNFIAGNQQAKYSRLPDWLSPKDFDNKDRTPQIILFGSLAIIIIIILAIVFINRKK